MFTFSPGAAGSRISTVGIVYQHALCPLGDGHGLMLLFLEEVIFTTGSIFRILSIWYFEKPPFQHHFDYTFRPHLNISHNESSINSLGRSSIYSATRHRVNSSYAPAYP
jgi:hypothetical protein